MLTATTSLHATTPLHTTPSPHDTTPQANGDAYGFAKVSAEKMALCAFRQKFTLEDAIGSHACSLEASMRVINGNPLGCPHPLTVTTVNYVAATLKVSAFAAEQGTTPSPTPFIPSYPFEAF
jgi:hypothetical protein